MFNYFIKKDYSKALHENNLTRIEDMRIDHLEALIDFEVQGAINREELMMVKQYLLGLDKDNENERIKIMFFDDNLKDVLHCFVLLKENRISNKLYDYIKQIRLTDPMKMLKNDRRRAFNDMVSLSLEIPIRIVVENLSDFYNFGVIDHSQMMLYLKNSLDGKNSILLDSPSSWGSNLHTWMMALIEKTNYLPTGSEIGKKAVRIPFSNGNSHITLIKSLGGLFSSKSVKIVDSRGRTYTSPAAFEKTLH